MLGSKYTEIFLDTCPLTSIATAFAFNNEFWTHMMQSVTLRTHNYYYINEVVTQSSGNIKGGITHTEPIGSWALGRHSLINSFTCISSILEQSYVNFCMPVSVIHYNGISTVLHEIMTAQGSWAYRYSMSVSGLRHHWCHGNNTGTKSHSERQMTLAPVSPAA